MPISVNSPSAPVSQKGPSDAYSSMLDLKRKQLEFSPCSSPGLSDHPATSLKRRFRREPVRGPESAFDSRFQTGITFSFAPSDSNHFLCVINQQFDSMMAAAPQSYAQPAEITFQAPSEASGHESEHSESDFEAEDLSTEFDELYEEREDSRAASRKAVVPASTTVGSRKTKQCACCGCTSTPLWRDMGKDMPLCNACGIRWKKYGVVCDACQYVPCKQERESKICKRCHAPLSPAHKRIRAVSPQSFPKKA